ncbi:MAG TPA: efflux RND transporter permease subunit [Acidobacteriota bacterium]|nr:efflux RND transporter permease subunit [Acidobacteriota bacterium]HQG90275.1 efflux RND transporter permease subunit [Acidobacteriota bacterium]
MNYIRGAISRPVTVSMFVVAVILFGIVSLDRLALNLLPDISYPSLTIDTAYTDAAPEEIESLITQPVEEAVGVVSGLTRISSVSRPGQSEVVLEFNWDTDMDLAVLDVREKLDFVELPRDAEKSVILRFDPSRDPVMRVRLQGLSDLRMLRFFAEKELKKNLEAMDGVAAIKVVGGLEEEVQINIDEKKLAELDIPITQVTDILQRENLNMASGSLYDQESSYMVRTLNEFKSLEEMRRIIIRDEGGRQVRLEDIAQVVRGAKDREVIARLNGRESVEVAIYKEGDANTVTVSRAVTRRLASLQEAKIIPADVSYAIVADQADFIEQAIGEVRSNAWMGGLLATIILFLFLKDVRSTLMIGLSIPISIMATFALMYQTDLTLNIMSLGGIALGIGMLVDNSIVVLEAIDRHKRSGLELAEAVYRGTTEVSMAVTASTLTTVAVFLPLVFVEGIAGQLFTDQALTITYSLLASLVVALTVLPMLMAVRFRRAEELYGADPTTETVTATAERLLSKRRWLRPFQQLERWIVRGIRALFRFIFGAIFQVVLADIRRIIGWIGRLLGRAIRPVLGSFDRVFLSLQRAYPNWLRLALDHKVVVIGLTLVVTLAAAGLYTTLGTELIPPLTQGEFTFEIQLPEGTSIEHTDRLMQDVEGRIKQYPEVATVFSSIGGSNENQFARQVRKENTAAVYLVMKDRLDKAAEARCIDRVRGELDTLPEVSYKFSRPAHFTFKRPIEVEVVTYDLEQLKTLSQRTEGILAGINGLDDIKTTAEMGNPEIHVIFDRERLARLGLDENQVARVIRNKIRGDVATRFKEQDKQIDIMVRANESDRTTVAQVRELVINSAAAADAPAPAGLGVPVKLGAVAEVVMAHGPNEIHHIKSSRAAVLSANLSGRDLGSVSAEINRELRRLAPELPANATVALSGQNEELQTAYRSLLFALGLAAFLVYLVMAAQFESLVHPFIIMFTVPLGAVGAVLGLAFTATPVSVMVFIGIIILVGIVVNNAIVLVDYANQLRAEGLSKREALVAAGQVRLRPILMTTLTTMLGLLPMSLGLGEGAEIRAPMAITVMSGLMFSTLLTLIVIPVVYEAVDRRVTAADQATAAAKPEPLTGLRPSACE